MVNASKDKFYITLTKLSCNTKRCVYTIESRYFFTRCENISPDRAGYDKKIISNF